MPIKICPLGVASTQRRLNQTQVILTPNNFQMPSLVVKKSDWLFNSEVSRIPMHGHFLEEDLIRPQLLGLKLMSQEIYLVKIAKST